MEKDVTNYGPILRVFKAQNAITAMTRAKRSASRTPSQLECEFNDGMWVPKTSSGKQDSPFAEKTMTQTVWLGQIRANNNSFGRYKDQWSACDHGTY